MLSTQTEKYYLKMCGGVINIGLYVIFVYHSFNLPAVTVIAYVI